MTIIAIKGFLLKKSTNIFRVHNKFYVNSNFVLKDKNIEYSDLETEYVKTNGPLISWYSLFKITFD